MRPEGQTDEDLLRFGWNDHQLDATDAVLEAVALQSLPSSFYSWFLKRGLFPTNPVAAMARPPH